MSDLYRLAQNFTQASQNLRLRFGKVDSIQTDRTITVTVAGSTETIANVKYAASMAPCPGKVVLLMTDGIDLFAFDHIAADDLTLAPRVFRNSDQTITNITDTAVIWQGVNSDSWSTWVSGSATYVSAPLTGRYMASAYVVFAGDADGFRRAWIRKNGGDTLAEIKTLSAASGSPTNLTVSTPAFDMDKGDYVELYVRHNAGNDLALSRDGNNTPALSLIYLGP